MIALAFSLQFAPKIVHFAGRAGSASAAAVRPKLLATFAGHDYNAFCSLSGLDQVLSSLLNLSSGLAESVLSQA